MLLTAQLPYLTADLPGLCLSGHADESPADRTGYYIKESPEDFQVDEIPITPASGEGEHLLLHIEKTRQTTHDVVRRLAKQFHVKKHDIGYAGMKDKNAITRQFFSIYLPTPKANRESDFTTLKALDAAPFKILSAQRHHQKLRRGHLRGNRFVIRIREIKPGDSLRVKPILARIAEYGIPNFFGEQRFGYRQNNHLIGQALLQQNWQQLLDLNLGMPQKDEHERARLGHEAYEAGDYLNALAYWPKHLRHERQALDALRQGKSPKEAVLAMEQRQRDFVISSFQSHLFNQVLARRMALDNWQKFLPGDLAVKLNNRAVFKVDLETANQENIPANSRMIRGEISPSGPMWGPDMMFCDAEALKIENEIFEQSGVTLEDFQRLKKTKIANVDGSRRPLCVRLDGISFHEGADEKGTFIEVTFNLPRGSFATIVLREIMKPTNGRLERYWGKGSLASETSDD